MSQQHPALKKILQRSRQQPACILLPEGGDSRIQQAAITAAKDGLACPVLLGKHDVLANSLGESANSDLVQIIDTASYQHLESMIDAYVALRAHKGATPVTARVAMADPMQFAAMMVRQGFADASIGDAVASTADTIRAALQIIGKAPNTSVVSSAMLMLNNQDVADVPDAMVFTDCAFGDRP